MSESHSDHSMLTLCNCERGDAEYNLASHAAGCPMQWDPSHDTHLKLWRVLRLIWETHGLRPVDNRSDALAEVYAMRAGRSW